MTFSARPGEKSGKEAPAKSAAVLRDDCFLHDRDRLKHGEALQILQDRLAPIAGITTIAVEDALGAVAAQAVTSPTQVPAADNAAVDGYAFAHRSYVSSDGHMPIAMRLQAGDTAPGPLPEGAAARIFTGAVMPDAADTVAMQEDCTAEGESVFVPPGLKLGANRRKAGEDLAIGADVIAAGHRLTVGDIAALASIGLGSVAVHTPLRVAIFSSGNELSEPASSKLAEQVFDANRPMLKSLLSTLPVEVSDLGVLPDDAEVFAGALTEAAKIHDVLITTGGASRGEADHLVSTLDRLGSRQMWQLAIKPGRPMCMGQLPGAGHPVPVFGLPGNPVAAFVSFLLYVRPSLLRLGGAEWVDPVRYPLPADFEIPRKKPDRREFLRGMLNTTPDGLVASKFPKDGSGLITGLREADGLIEIPEATTSVRHGDIVDFLPFGSFGL
ncbi:MAG: gephyrin-like molybdotransferase Glp [Pseudomonadota bacterium]